VWDNDSFPDAARKFASGELLGELIILDRSMWT